MELSRGDLERGPPTCFDRVFAAFSLQMVGIGTAEVNIEKFNFSFGSLLGHDEDSWGLSYTGERDGMQV